MYKYEISGSKVCGNDFFFVGCDEVFISALSPLNDFMESGLAVIRIQ